MGVHVQPREGDLLHGREVPAEIRGEAFHQDPRVPRKVEHAPIIPPGLDRDRRPVCVCACVRACVRVCVCVREGLWADKADDKVLCFTFPSG